MYVLATYIGIPRMADKKSWWLIDLTPRGYEPGILIVHGKHYVRIRFVVLPAPGQSIPVWPHTEANQDYRTATIMYLSREEKLLSAIRTQSCPWVRYLRTINVVSCFHIVSKISRMGELLAVAMVEPQ